MNDSKRFMSFSVPYSDVPIKKEDTKVWRGFEGFWGILGGLGGLGKFCGGWGGFGCFVEVL